MKKEKIYEITKTKCGTFSSKVSNYKYKGTIEELIKTFSYTLECGDSYSREKGNKKINCNPKNIESLVKNIYNAGNNSAANGYSGCSYTFTEISE